MIETTPHLVTGLVHLRPDCWPPLNGSEEQARWLAAVQVFGVEPTDMSTAGRPPQITYCVDQARLDVDLFDRDENGHVQFDEGDIKVRAAVFRADAAVVREAIANA